MLKTTVSHFVSNISVIITMAREFQSQSFHILLVHTKRRSTPKYIAKYILYMTEKGHIPADRKR